MMTLEEAQEARHSLVWKNVCKELDYRKDILRELLLRCNAEELDSIQTKIRLYEEVKKLPDDVVEREEPYPASD